MSNAPGAVPALFADLLDDAAMFPPGNAAPDVAAADHATVKRGPHADCVGPLLVRPERFDELVRAADDVGRLDVVVVGSDWDDRSTSRVAVVGVEEVWDGALIEPRRTRLALEPTGFDAVEDLLEAVGEARLDGAAVIAKFRTGGVTADAFPSEADLAFCLVAAYNAGVPFKLTAGLHHAVRHSDAQTGFERHGFLNVMVGVAQGLDGAGQAEVADVLAVRDGSALVAEIRGWDVARAVDVRSLFTSFGCCGVEDPIHDLVAMQLIGRSASAGAAR